MLLMYPLHTINKQIHTKSNPNTMVFPTVEERLENVDKTHHFLHLSPLLTNSSNQI